MLTLFQTINCIRSLFCVVNAAVKWHILETVYILNNVCILYSAL